MRVLVRLMAVMSGLAVSIAGALLGMEVIWAWLNPETAGLLVPWTAIRSTLIEVSWNETPVRLTAVAMVAVGLLVLFVAIKAGPRDIPLRSPVSDVTVTTDPRSLARLIGHRVRDQAGVTASIIATPKRVQVAATSRASDLDEVRGLVVASAEQAVQELPLLAAPEISVGVRQAKERR